MEIILPFTGFVLALIAIYICFRKRFKAYVISGNKSIREEQESEEAVNAWLKSQQ
jgi:hypothetical protein